jgi:serine/threonine protein kinase
MSATNSDTDSLVGVSIDGGRYTIIKLIGEGGMGRVFQARQTSMNRMVALKILRRQLLGDTQLLERFEREAKSIAQLRHPNSINIIDYGRTEDGFFFMAMELLAGRSLYAILRDEGAMNLPRTLRIFAQVLGAVREAHDLGIVHRDLKPENIQIDHVANGDFAKVLDFGIAKIVHGDGTEPEGDAKSLTLAGAVFGTPHYMSPEQVHGRTIDHRTDIYSLGVILFEMLTGEPPFDGATPMAVMMAQASKPPPDLREISERVDLTDSVVALVRECLQKDPDARPATVAEILGRVYAIQLEVGESSVRFSAAALGNRRSESGVLASAGVPHVMGANDAGPTPSFMGQLDSAMPGDLEALGSRKGVWLALAALVLAGGGFFAWQATQESGPTPAEVGSPVLANFSADSTNVYKITSEPSGALVFAQAGDTDAIGVTPATIRLSTDQAHTLQLRLPGRVPGTAVFAKNTTERATHVKLASADPRDLILLESTPSGAEVYRGDSLVGTTPHTWKPKLTPLPVELRFAFAGHREHVESIKLELAGDAPRSVTVALKPQAAVKPVKPTPPVVKTAARRRPIRRKPRHRPASKPHHRPATKPAHRPASTPSSYEKL